MKIFESGSYFDVFSIVLKVENKESNKPERFNIEQINPLGDDIRRSLNEELKEEEVEEILGKVIYKRDKLIQLSLEVKEELTKTYGLKENNINIDDINEVDWSLIKNKILDIESRATDNDIQSLIFNPFISYISLPNKIVPLPNDKEGTTLLYKDLEDDNDHWCLVVEGVEGNRNCDRLIKSKDTFYLELVGIPYSLIKTNRLYKCIKCISDEDLKIEEMHYYIDLSIKGTCKLGLLEWPKADQKIISNYLGNITFNEELPFYGRVKKIKSRKNIDNGVEIIRNTKALMKELISSGVIDTIDNI